LASVALRFSSRSRSRSVATLLSMRSIEEPRPPLVARTHSAPEAVPPDDHASGVRAGAPADGSGQRALLLQRVAAHTFGMASPRGTVVECRGHASSARTFIYAKVAFDLAALAARACALEIVASATPTVSGRARGVRSSPSGGSSPRASGCRRAAGRRRCPHEARTWHPPPGSRTRAGPCRRDGTPSAGRSEGCSPPARVEDPRGDMSADETPAATPGLSAPGRASRGTGGHAQAARSVSGPLAIEHAFAKKEAAMWRVSPEWSGALAGEAWANFSGGRAPSRRDRVSSCAAGR